MMNAGEYAVSKRNITIDRAREILGNNYNHLSDKQIEIILRSLYALSERIISSVTKKL